MYPFKVNYQRDNFQIIHQNIEDENVNEFLYNNLEKDVIKSHSENLTIDMSSYFTTLPNTIKKALDETPYKKDKVVYHNLYMSCLITILRCVTLSNYNKKRFDNFSNKDKENLIQNIYAEESLNAPVV